MAEEIATAEATAPTENQTLDMGDFVVEFVSIDDIVPDGPETNPRVHTERNREIIDTSFNEFGPQRSIVINGENYSLAGTGALEAAKKNGVKQVAKIRFKDPARKRETLLAVVADDLTPEQQDRYRFTDNVAGETGGWNPTVVTAMREAGTLRGFDVEVQKILSSGPLHTDGNDNDGNVPDDKGARVDEAAALMKKWGVKPGQIWEIPSQTARGDSHRLMCGQSDRAEDVRALMAGARARLFATDPPYAVAYDGRNHPHQWAGRDKEREKLRKELPPEIVEALEFQHDEDVDEELDPEAVPKDQPVDVLISRAQFEEGFYGEWDNITPEQAAKLWLEYNQVAVAEAIDPHAAWYCCHASKHQALLERCWNRAGAFMHQQYIWVKNRPIFTRSWGMWQHEPIMMGWIKGNKPQRVIKAYERTTWFVDTIPPGQHGLHPTEKPVEVFAKPIRQHCKPGEIAFEPFGGSGVCMVAGEQNRVITFTMEANPKWVGVQLQRAEDMGLHPGIVEGPNA